MKCISILVLIVCACFVSVALGQSPAAVMSSGQNWSEFHTPNMRRWNPFENLLNVNNVGNLTLLWSYTTGGDGVYSSPAVANGVVYVGSGDGNLYAFGLTRR